MRRSRHRLETRAAEGQTTRRGRGCNGCGFLLHVHIGSRGRRGLRGLRRVLVRVRVAVSCRRKTGEEIVAVVHHVQSSKACVRISPCESFCHQRQYTAKCGSRPIEPGPPGRERRILCHDCVRVSQQEDCAAGLAVASLAATNERLAKACPQLISRFVLFSA